MVPTLPWRMFLLTSATVYYLFILISFSSTSALAQDKAPIQSTFISPNQEVSFAVTVPPRSAPGGDVFFTLRAPVGISWAAVGLGSSTMDHSLVLMIYRNAEGKNVTFSPRQAIGNFEPFLLDEVKVDILEGTGLFDQGGKQYMVFRARCHSGCRNWHRGNIDVFSNNVRGIYAFGPNEDFFSDDNVAPIKYHVEHGSFTIDMQRTQGASQAPVLDANSVNEGATLQGNKKVSTNKSLAHGLLMIFGAVFCYPLGVFLLRRVGYKYHVLVQVLGTALIIAAFGLAIVISLLYQRSKKFRDTHQILGFILFASVLAQPVLGYLQHAHYVRTQQKSPLGSVHKWLGWLIYFFAIINASLGFNLALNNKAGKIFSGVVVGVCVLLILVWVFGLVRKRHPLATPRAGNSNPNQMPPPTYGGDYAPPGQNFPSRPQSSDGTGLQPQQQPWRRQDNPPAYDSEYESQQRGIDLVPVTSPRGDASKHQRTTRNDEDLGPAQAPREFT